MKNLRPEILGILQRIETLSRRPVEFKPDASLAVRAAYGERLVPCLAASLTHEYGRGFDERNLRNLRNMRSFFLASPIWNALRTKLNWTHYRALLKLPIDAEIQHSQCAESACAAPSVGDGASSATTVGTCNGNR